MNPQAKQCTYTIFAVALLLTAVRSAPLTSCRPDTDQPTRRKCSDLLTVTETAPVTGYVIGIRLETSHDAYVTLNLNEKTIRERDFFALDKDARIVVYQHNGATKDVPMHVIHHRYYEGDVTTPDDDVRGTFSGNYKNGLLSGSLYRGDIDYLIRHDAAGRHYIEQLEKARPGDKARKKMEEDAKERYRRSPKPEVHIHRYEDVLNKQNGRRSSVNDSADYRLPKYYDTTSGYESSNSRGNGEQRSHVNTQDSSPSGRNGNHDNRTDGDGSSSNRTSQDARHKRAFFNKYRVCKLHIVVDVTFYKRRCHESLVCCLRMVDYMVKYTDIKYRSIDFNYDGVSDNIGFVISKVPLCVCVSVCVCVCVFLCACVCVSTISRYSREVCICVLICNSLPKNEIYKIRI